jgi:hypothetical protein
VNAGLLARSGGKYRCGKCEKIGNALESLFDEWPAAGERPPAAGAMPVLGMPIDLGKAQKTRLNPDDDVLDDDAGADPGMEGKRGNLLLRFTWITLALVVAAVITLKVFEFYEIPLAEMPAVQSAKTRLGIQDPPPALPFRDLDQIHLVSRELRSHPYRVDTLRLTVTIVNRAPETQAFPGLEVVLLDANGQPVSTLRFDPEDYLARGTPGDSGMTPQAYLPLVLDLEDPGSKAVGFELNFL